MTNRLSKLFSRIFGEKSSSAWISSTVTASDAASGRYSQPPGQTFISRATGYVLICALKNAEACASQRLRLYAPAGAKSKRWKGKRLKASTVAERRRLKYLKRRINGPGTKAAEYAEYAGDVQEVTDHPALDLLRKPNPWQSGAEFEELTYAYKELAGNAYTFDYFDEAVPEMYLLGPQWTTIIPDDHDFIRGYYYARDKADPRTFDTDVVRHMKHKASPLNPYYGIGPLQAVLIQADLTAAADQAELSRWLNGGRPDFVVEVDAATANNQTARDQIKAEIKRETQGVKKSGRFLILGNSKIVPLGFRPKDMEYLNGLSYSNELIWNAFGVPQSEFEMNDANYASSTTGNVQYLSRTVSPRCCRHAGDLTEDLLPKFGEEPGALWFAYDQIVPEDETAEAEMDRLDVAAGILKINEARANRGLEEEEGGDVLRINGQSLERLDAPPPVPMLGGGFGDNGEEPDPKDEVVKVLAGLLEAKHDVLQRQAVATGADANMVRSAGDGAGRTAEAGDRTGGRIEAQTGLKFYGSHVHTKDDDRLTGVPRGALASIDQFAARLEMWHRRVLADALAAGHAGTIITIPGDELQKIIDEELRMILNASARAGAREVGGSLEVAPTSAFEYLDAYKIQLSHAITDDLATSLNDAIRGGLAQGETYDQVTDRVQQAMPEAARWRSERIARTETATAVNEGRVFAWDELGVKEKQWLLSGNACGLCQAVALTYAGPIPMNQPFYRVGDTITGTDGSTMTVTWRDVNAAPLHPACACGLLPVV